MLAGVVEKAPVSGHAVDPKPVTSVPLSCGGCGKSLGVGGENARDFTLWAEEARRLFGKK